MEDEMGEEVEWGEEKENSCLDDPDWLTQAFLRQGFVNSSILRDQMGFSLKDKKIVYVAVLHSMHDGSGGPAKLLGAYTQTFLAEARCYRELKNLGYDQPTDIVALEIDKDYDLDAANSKEVQAMWGSVPMPEGST